MPTAYLAGLALLLPACLHAAWSDLFRRLIPNTLCAATALAGIAVASLSGPAVLGSHAAHFILALLGGMLVFRLGMIGGGDAKFYAACAAWFALPQGLRLLVSVALAGLLLFIGWFVVRRIQQKPIRRAGDGPFDRLPYGLAIAAATVQMALVPF